MATRPGRNGSHETLIMHDSAPDPEGRRDGKPELGPAPSPAPSGLTRFLVENPTSAEVSREALVEGVRALLRERDYLRRARDLQHADIELERAAQREHVEQLEQLQVREARAHQEQTESLRRELVALQSEVEMLIRERVEIRVDRDACRADRDEWRARANSSFIVRAGKALLGLAGRVFRTTRKDRGTGTQAHSNDRTQGA